MFNKKFIVLEGLDRSGKTTVSKILAQKIHNSVIFAFPNRNSQSGKLLNNILKDNKEYIDKHELHLLFSANRYHEMQNISQALKTNHVICDRYFYSGTAYSVANNLDYEWCELVDKYLLKPDVIFFIDINADLLSQRKDYGKEINENIFFQKKVYNVYKEMTKNIDNMIPINGNQNIEKIVEDIIFHLKKNFDMNITLNK